ncbi:MAG: FtsK/SpoIIIE domain-containing protein [Oscillospiraceae bacterium]|nr:FtsK/SpoIIIE domain-containing protein [Oscillospiraceae bacterium]
MSKTPRRKPPKLFVRRGKRIRPRNVNLLLRFALMTLVPLFLLVVAVFHIRILLTQDWQSITVPYALVSVGVAVVVCAVAAFLYRHYRYDSIKKRSHRQILARMIRDNGWCEKKTVEGREKIRRFAPMWYKKDDFIVTVTVTRDGGKHYEQMQTLAPRLETALFSELIASPASEGYLEYKLLYDSINGRITIDKVTVTDGRMKLMETCYWDIDGQPHMLVAGGTGGGKTFFLLSVIYALLSQTNARLTICDVKYSALIDLGEFMPHVYSDAYDILDALIRFKDDMQERYIKMRERPGYDSKQNYAYMGLEPHFFVFDEYVATYGRLDSKAQGVLVTALRDVVLAGRQCGYFMILATQRPDAKFLETDVRDNFNFRVTLGSMTAQGYAMMFGETKKMFMQKDIKGRGYHSGGDEIIPELFAPYVPDDFKFQAKVQEALLARGDKLVPATKKKVDAVVEIGDEDGWN